MQHYDPDATRRLLDGCAQEPVAGNTSIIDLVNEAAVHRGQTTQLLQDLSETLNQSGPCLHDTLLVLTILMGLAAEQHFGDPLENKETVVAIVTDITNSLNSHTDSFGDAFHALNGKTLALVRGMAVVRNRTAADLRERLG